VASRWQCGALAPLQLNMARAGAFDQPPLLKSPGLATTRKTLCRLPPLKGLSSVARRRECWENVGDNLSTRLGLAPAECLPGAIGRVLEPSRCAGDAFAASEGLAALECGARAAGIRP